MSPNFTIAFCRSQIIHIKMTSNKENIPTMTDLMDVDRPIVVNNSGKSHLKLPKIK